MRARILKEIRRLESLYNNQVLDEVARFRFNNDLNSFLRTQNPDYSATVVIDPVKRMLVIWWSDDLRTLMEA